MTAYNREQIREEMLKRSQETYTGIGSYRYFNAEGDLPLWSPKPTKETPYIIDILPFQAGENYPILDKRNPIKSGTWVYRLEALVHQNIGPRKEWVICPAVNYGLPCPICEEISERQANGEEYETYSNIANKRRCAYNVIVYNDKDEDIVQIWEVSYKYSEKQIRLQAKSPRTGGIEPFADPDVGKSISFEVANDTYRTIQGHKLVARDYTISDEILSKVYKLDEEIVLMTYEEIDKIFHFRGEDSEKKNDRNTTTFYRSRAEKTKIKQDALLFDKKICPHSGNFGEDIDKLNQCGECESYDICAVEADRIALERKKKRDARKAGTGKEEALSEGKRLHRPRVERVEIEEDVPF